MHRYRAHERLVVLLSLAMLGWLGCNGGLIPDDVKDLLSQAGIDNVGELGIVDGLHDLASSATEEGLFQVLGERVAWNPERLVELAADEEPYFGEDPALYAVEDFDADAVPDDLPVGGWPWAHGSLAGRFINDVPGAGSDESGGIFRGQWLAEDGTPLGVLRGEYHPIPPTELPGPLTGGGVFYGKYIDTEGHFVGLLRGRYGHGPDGEGLFFGRWFDRHDRLVGVLRGRWIDGPEGNGGQFMGHWGAFNLCDEVASLPEYAFEEGDFGGLEPTDEPIEGVSLPWAFSPIEGEVDYLLADGPPCIDPDQPYGFLRGWHFPPRPPEEDPEAPPTGTFRGRWRNANQEVTGLLFGRHRHLEPPEAAAPVRARVRARLGATAGPSQAAEGFAAPVEEEPRGRIRGVFYGKYVGPDGDFRGFIRGVYGRSVHGLGVFRGHYFNPEGDEQGMLGGRWSVAPDRVGGPFFGIWFGTDLDAEP